MSAGYISIVVKGAASQRQREAVVSTKQPHRSRSGKQHIQGQRQREFTSASRGVPRCGNSTTSNISTGRCGRVGYKNHRISTTTTPRQENKCRGRRYPVQIPGTGYICIVFIRDYYYIQIRNYLPQKPVKKDWSQVAASWGNAVQVWISYLQSVNNRAGNRSASA